MKSGPQGALSIRFSDLLKMAIPISLGTMLQFFVLATDNFFLSRLSQEAINGAGNAGLVYLTLEMIAVGSSAALQIVIARRIGEGKREEAFQTFRSGLMIHLAMGIGLMGLAWGLNAGPLQSTIADPRIQAVFNEFFTVRLLGFIPFSLFLAVNALYTGMAKTWPILVVGFISATSNVFMDAAWVEGWWGFTPMGAIGAAWASFFAETIGCVLSLALIFVLIPTAMRPWSWLPRESLNAWWKLAYPLMGQFLTTISTWTAFFFLVEKVGGLELKVSHLTRNFFMLAFIVAQGMQQTTRTYVSGLIGEGRQAELPGALKRIVTLNLGGILLLCHGYVLYPEFLGGWFFESAMELEAMTRTLHVIFVAVLIYAFTGIMLATIQGSGATTTAFRIEALAVTCYMFVAAAMTVVWPQPIWIIWRVEWVYFMLIGLGSWYYLRTGQWKSVPVQS